MMEVRTDFTQLQASVEATKARARELRAESFAIQRRLIATQYEIMEVFDRTQATLEVVRQHLGLLCRSAERKAPEIEVVPGNALLQTLAALGRGESDLGEIIDDLIAVYKAARA